MGNQVTEPKYRQLYFDMDGIIRQETVINIRELTKEEAKEYEIATKDANQMTIWDYL